MELNLRLLTLTYLLIVLQLLVFTANCAEPSQPPVIHEESNREVYYFNSSVSLTCQAQTDQYIKYTWKKNDTVTRKDSTVGNYVIEAPTESDHGVYQCFARNSLGTAVSNKFHLRQRKFSRFPTVSTIRQTLTVGAPYKIECPIPDIFPKPKIWYTVSIGESREHSKNVPLDDRISLDYEGNLYFANVNETDAEGRFYHCMVENANPRDGVDDGCWTVLNVNARAITYNAVKLEWTSPETMTVVEGDIAKMKCIFSGLPTPTVKWTKGDSEVAKGQELIFEKVTTANAGRYFCTGSNGQSQGNKGLTLIVEAKPSFVKKPTDTNKKEGERVEFECQAKGNPPPSVTWMIDGETLEENGRELDPNNRPRLEQQGQSQSKLIYNSLHANNTEVIQCVIGNKHGDFVHNFFLKVDAFRPTISLVPKKQLVLINAIANFSCRADGAPKPVIEWTRNGSPLPMNDKRIERTPEGDLKIKQVRTSDNGNYVCSASNRLGKESTTPVELSAREKTIISVRPKDQVVNASNVVEFKCTAQFDANDKRKSYTWKRDGAVISGENGDTLTIRSAAVSDSGTYLCIVESELDNDKASATLVVQDKPSVPSTNISCENDPRDSAKRYVRYIWSTVSENNSPLIEYVIYSFNSTIPVVEPVALTEFKRMPTGQLSLREDVHPNTIFYFYVRARNGAGLSEPSITDNCQTDPTIPARHPSGGCTEPFHEKQLIIHWAPLEKWEQNGPGFHYKVVYRQAADANALNSTKTTTSTELVIDEKQDFTGYFIWVFSVNAQGEASGQPAPFTGHSGEGTPQVNVTGFKYIEGSANATSASFEWNKLGKDETTPLIMKGYFRGYRIFYWKKGKEDFKRHTNVVLIDKKMYCRPNKTSGGRESRFRRSDFTELWPVHDLWPFSTIVAAVSAINGGQAGPMSDTVTFQTPEGVPGPVFGLEVSEVASNHLKIKWDPPVDENGILVKYHVRYHPEDDPSNKREVELSPDVTMATLKNLTVGTPYVIEVVAETEPGKGLARYVKQQTRDHGVPDVPGFNEIIADDNSANVSWIPSTAHPQHNPGQSFCVEYKRSEEHDWERVCPPEDQSWVNVTGLEPPGKYDFRIVAITGDGLETNSKVETRRIGPGAEEVAATASISLWFIILMVVILLLLLILLIVCLIKRNRGGKYPVWEKEKLRTRDPEDDDDKGFNEYAKTPMTAQQPKGHEPEDKRPLRDTLGDDNGLDSDEDSMDYDQMDASKFNEDGSFIGQYGQRPYQQNDLEATSPHALSTFV